MCAFTTSLEPTGSEVLMCVRGELEEYVEEVFLHLERAGFKQTSACFSHVCAVMRDFTMEVKHLIMQVVNWK